MSEPRLMLPGKLDTALNKLESWATSRLLDAANEEPQG